MPKYLKKDKVLIAALQKNASQALKQVSIQNDGFELIMSTTEDLVDWDDKNLLVLLPIRAGFDREFSELLETLRYGGYESYYDIPREVVESRIDDWSENGFYPKLDYFDNDLMKKFIGDVLFNENWKGCKIRFFDLKKLSTHLPQYLGWDIEIPIYNTAENDAKLIARGYFESITNETYKDIKIKRELGSGCDIHELFFRGLRKSKYWIEL